MFKQRYLTFVCSIILAAMLVVPFSASPAYAAAVVTNPGFEADKNVTTSP